MEIERRALYNLMRMNWLVDSSIAAEPWQVEDYRSLPLEELFSRLSAHDIRLNRNDFLAFANEVDTPEELTDYFLEESDADTVTQDQIYLLLFELWRRLVTDRPSLSIFCDELDHQIHLYDSEEARDEEALQNAIANFQEILDENCDKGIEPIEVFESICSDCANDIESFLYDYITDLLQENHEIYARELLEGFSPYIRDSKWFDYLRANLLFLSDPESTQKYIDSLIDAYGDQADLDFNLELLTFMVQGGKWESLVKLLKMTIPLIVVEDDFRSVLEICADFFHYLDDEKREEKIQKIVTKREHLHPESIVSRNDPFLAELMDIVKK